MRNLCPILMVGYYAGSNVCDPANCECSEDCAWFDRGAEDYGTTCGFIVALRRLADSIIDNRGCGGCA